MKKIIIITITLLALTSCGNDYIEDGKNLIKNQKELTNAELLSKIDTNNVYYAVIEHNELYTINVKTKLVEHRIVDSSSIVQFLIIVIIVMFLMIMLYNAIYN